MNYIKDLNGKIIPVSNLHECLLQVEVLLKEHFDSLEEEASYWDHLYISLWQAWLLATQPDSQIQQVPMRR